MPPIDIAAVPLLPAHLVFVAAVPLLGLIAWATLFLLAADGGEIHLQTGEPLSIYHLLSIAARNGRSDLGGIVAAMAIWDPVFQDRNVMPVAGVVPFLKIRVCLFTRKQKLRYAGAKK